MIEAGSQQEQDFIQFAGEVIASALFREHDFPTVPSLDHLEEWFRQEFIDRGKDIAAEILETLDAYNIELEVK